VLARRIQTVDGFKVGIAQVELLRVAVHHLHKLRLAASNIVCQRHAGIVAGVNDQATAQIAHRDAISRLDKHQRGAIKYRISLCPGVFTNGNNIVRRDALAIDSAVNHVAGHQLGEASRVTLLMFIACGQYLPRGVVH